MREIIYERPGLLDTPHTGGELIDSGRFAFLLLMGADVMLFVGLFGGYVVLRANTLSWPPPGSPLPSPTLMIWTCPLIVLSGIALMMAVRFDRRGLSSPRTIMIGCAVIADLGFLALNGLEWSRMFSEGLELRTVFGGIFLVTVGAVLAHVLGGLVVALRAIFNSGATHSPPNRLPHLAYYFFVLALVWLSLYGLVYL